MNALATPNYIYGIEWVSRGKPYTRYQHDKAGAEAFARNVLSRGRTDVVVIELFKGPFGDFLISDFNTISA